MTTNTLRLRLSLTLLGVGIALLGLWRFTSGYLDLQGISFFLSLLAVPYVMYLSLLKTCDGSLWTGLLMVGMVVAVQMMVSSAWERGSSTAPLGYLWLPIAGVFVVGAAAVIDRSRM